MNQEIYSISSIMDKGNKKFRVHIFLLWIFICLLPISTGLDLASVGNVSLLNYIFVLYVAFRLINLLFNRKLHINKLVLLAIVYYIYFVSGFVFNFKMARLDWFTMTFMANGIMFFFIITDIYTRKELEGIIFAIYFSGILSLLFAVLNIRSMFTGRLTITIFSTIGINTYALSLLTVNAVLLYIIVYSKAIRWFYILFLCMVLVLILFTGSRGAFLVFFMQTFCCLWLKSKKKFKIIATYAMALLVLLTIYTFIKDFIPDYITNRLTFEAIKDTGGNGRIAIWTRALNIFSNSNLYRIFFGYGLNSFSEITYADSFIENMISHNVFIQTLIEGGIFGLVTILLFFYACIKEAVNKGNIFALLAIVGVITACLTIDFNVNRVFALSCSLAFIFPKQLTIYSSKSPRKHRRNN